LDDKARFTIAYLRADGEPIIPGKPQVFIRQAGVLVRENLLITTQEWNKTKTSGESYVSQVEKETLWNKLMVNFTLPVGADEEERIAIEKRVRAWTFKRMATQFKDYKKRLNLVYVQKDKTPVFTGALERLKDQWAEFARYKKSEEAQKRSAINKKNAKKKIYHHTMGSKGYKGVIHKMMEEEAALAAKGIETETHGWSRRAKLWFYGMGGRLHPETGKCVFTRKMLETPIANLKKAMKEIMDGTFIPDREKDDLSRALGNKEHWGRARGIIGSPPWIHAFPDDIDTYRSRGRTTKEQKDRLKALEDLVATHHITIQEIKSQQATGPHHPPEDNALLDSPGPGSHRKSSVASTGLPGDDDHDGVVKDLTRYPVDDITAQENCEMHVEFINISVKVAAGYALPCIPGGSYHCRPIPDGYSIVTVDEVVPQYNELRLEFPAGEDGELTKLGAAKRNTILWRKQFIVLPDWQPPPPPSPQHPPSPARQPSPQPSTSPPARQPSPQAPQSPPVRHPSPQPPPSPPTRQHSQQPPPYPARRLKRKGSTNTPATSATAPKKSSSGSATNKKGKEPEIVIDPEDAKRLLRNLRRPPPDLPSDYDRAIIKAHDETVKKPRARAKQVAQLGEQENQSCPPLKVVSSYDHQVELARRYEIEAHKLGVTMVQYLSMLPEFDDAEEEYPMAELAYKYTPGQPLLRNPDDIPKLSTKMRRLHQWYMSASTAKVEYIILAIQEEHYFRGDAFIHVEMEELFQLFNKDAIDVSVLSCYCL
jgi:hypothetical protein